MQISKLSAHKSHAQPSSVLAFIALFVLVALLAIPRTVAQPSYVAPPGDAPASAGPLAHLSAKVTRPNLAKAIKLVADWQLDRMPAIAQDDWTWAALYDGFMAIPDSVAGDKYKQAMLRIGEQLHWQPGPHVMLADDLAVGQMYLEQYFLHKDPKMLDPMRARLDKEMAIPESEWITTPVSWWDDSHYAQTPLWWWCDALFMAPPVFADMYKATGDPRYLAFMAHQWTLTTDLLYDRNVHLYSRDASFLELHGKNIYQFEKNPQKVFWSRGNGWVMGGIVRVLQKLPADSPYRPQFVKLLKQMSAEMLSIQGKDGLWRSSLLDPAAYPLPEISGSAFITYAMAYGVNHGILDRTTYWPAVKKAWAGMLKHVYADGRLGCIQPEAAAPGPYSKTSSYVYGVGAYLLAGSEIYQGVK